MVVKNLSRFKKKKKKTDSKHHKNKNGDPQYF